MKDAQGNDISAVAVPVTGAICLVKYDPKNVITPEMIAVTKATPELPDAYDRAKACLGLITSDGGPQDASDQDDAIDFYQQGYSLNAQPTLTTAFTLAEDNPLTRRVSYGHDPDEYGVYHVTTYTPDEKWMAYQEETLKNGQVTRRAGVVQVTGNEPGQSERGSVKGRALTVTWQSDPLYGDVPYIEAPYRPDENTPDTPDQPTTVPVESISLAPATADVDEGKTVTLTPTILPADATDKTITWTSDHEDIATVKDGVVTGVKAGIATITATTTDGAKTATTAITVNPVLGNLTVKAAARIGGQTITVTEPIDNGLQRRYRVDAKAPALAYDAVVDTANKWEALPENGEINAAAGQVITVVDNTTQGAKARKVGTATLPAPLTAIYVGVSASAADAIDAAAIKALTVKGVTGTTAAGTYDVNAAGDTDYILFALPATFKAPTFSAGGFDGGFAKAKTVSVDGVDYDVWRSDNAGLGEITVTVK